MMNEKNYGHEKRSIKRMDIERCRRCLKVGQQVRIRVPGWDSDFRRTVLYRQCTVDEKHRWLFIARDQRGKRYAVTYVDMLMQGGV